MANWDGIFHKWYGPPNFIVSGWVSGDSFEYEMGGSSMCRVTIEFTGCISGVPQWQMELIDGAGNTWQGEKSGGNTPAGIFTRTGGAYNMPLSLTIAAGPSTTTAATVIGCGL